MGRVFHALGLIEQWARGVQRMSAACREAGLDAPALDELATRSRVSVSTTPGQRFTRDQTDEAILALASASAGLLTSERVVDGSPPR